MRASKLPFAFAAALAALLVACGSGPVDSSAPMRATETSVESGNCGNEAVTVVSRNLYLGADLRRVMAATTPDEFVAATTTVWGMVQKNDFAIRARAIAQEIANVPDAPADLVGLQEAYLWELAAPGSTEFKPVYDYVKLVLRELEDLGLDYRVVSKVKLFRFEAPVLTPEGSLATVRMTDRGVILARDHLKVRKPHHHVFETLLPVQVLGETLLVKRGFATVEVMGDRECTDDECKYKEDKDKHECKGDKDERECKGDKDERECKGDKDEHECKGDKDEHECKGKDVWFKFATVHLEAYDEDVAIAQAAELAEKLHRSKRPVILVGDLNSTPGTAGELVLANTGFEDVWAKLFPAVDGFTDGWPEDLTVVPTPAVLTQRIDYVLYRDDGDVTPKTIRIVGDEVGDRVDGLWPSDHAGLVSTLDVERRHRCSGEADDDGGDDAHDGCDDDE